MDLIKQEGNHVNTIYINKEHNDFKQILTADDLFFYVKSRLSESKSNYVFIDEIQEIDEFEIALRQLHVEGIDLYCTGSNAKMLSGDLATHLSGRYIEFHINSLSYKEFLQIHKLENNNDTLNKYICYGYLKSIPLFHFQAATWEMYSKIWCIIS
jgi:predicted AAA+ superfamily ATPase